MLNAGNTGTAEGENMALLEGDDFQNGQKSFGIAPAAREGGDAVKYTVTLKEGLNTEPLFYTFSIEGWLMGQDDLWVIARAFTEVSKLADAVLPIDIWRSGRMKRANYFVSCDWLEAVLAPYKQQGKVRMVFYVREDEGDDIFRRFFIQANIDQVEQFGRALEQEIIDASPNWALWASERGLLKNQRT